jgi:hypothetical protein
MRTNAKELALVVLFASAAFGQASSEQMLDRVFHFAHTETAQGFQQIATVMRMVAGIQQLFVVEAPGVLTLRASADQVALAEWLFSQLDKPAAGQPVQQVQNSLVHEYRVPGSGDDVVKVFYLTHTQTAQDLQEIVTAIRVIANIQRIFQCFQCSVPRTLALHGTAAQTALAQWLVDELDKSTGGGHLLGQPSENSVAHEYRVPGNGDDLVRVFYLTHTETPQGLQEIVTAIRAVTDLQRVFPCTATKAVTLR